MRSLYRALCALMILAITVPSYAGPPPGSASTDLTTVTSNLAFWARNFRGVGDRYPAMVTPPIMTMGTTSTSTVDTSKSGGNVTYGAASAPIIVTHATPLFSSGRAYCRDITNADGSVTAQNTPCSIRFQTDAPSFDVAVLSYAGVSINCIVDGQYCSRDGTNTPIPDNTANARYINFNFGSDPNTYYVSGLSGGVIAATAGGTGYAIGDILTLTATGVTCTTAPQLRVTQVTSGVISTGSLGALVYTPGACSSVNTSAGAWSVSATTGSGSGAAFTLPTWGKRAGKMRHIEIVASGLNTGFFSFYGIVTTKYDVVEPWPVPARTPKGLVIGDSQNAGTYLQYSGGHMSASWSQQLGLWDNLYNNSVGGTGLCTANVNGEPFSGVHRLADEARINPDYIVIDGSQNDVSQTAAQLQACLTTMFTAYQSVNPRVAIVVVGPVVGLQTTWQMAAPAAIAAAPYPANIRMIDNLGEGWFTNNGFTAGNLMSPGSNGNFDRYLTTGSHLTQYGVDVRANLLAPRIAAALVSIAGNP